MEYLDKFSERLKDLRKEKELTTRELGKAIGLSHSSITSWESKQYEPKMLSIIALAKFFDVSADYLLGLSDDY